MYRAVVGVSQSQLSHCCSLLEVFYWKWVFYFQIKDQAQKTEFLESLNSEIDNFPSSFCRHKILPQLIKAFEFGDAGANILMPLLKVSSTS